jgi:16S rRNA (adenine1518-N6/adenine1519-N6)-dimethyltransferase
MSEIRAKKSLGQNFLHDRKVIENIVQAINPQSGDLLIEIGPGTGALSEIIPQKGISYKAIEIDPRAVKILEKMFKQNDFENFEIIQSDFLKINLNEIINSGEIKGEVKIFGNLPYYITSQIIFKILESDVDYHSCTFMTQREVAQRISAHHGNKDFGVLTVACALKSRAELLFDVSPESFDPVPKVWSSTLRLTKKGDITYEKFKSIMRITKMAFGQRRKMISNSLKSQINLLDNKSDEISKIKKYLNKRPEQLSVEEIIHLADILNNAGK